MKFSKEHLTHIREARQSEINWEKREQMKKAILELYFKKKYSLRDVADKLNCSAGLIRYYMKIHGLKARKKPECNRTKRAKDKVIESLKGNKRALGFNHTEEMKNYFSENASGANNPNWKGGTCPERQLAWQRKEYKKWRMMILKRDGYKCVLCGDTKGRFHFHHIKHWATHKNLRYEISNGVTLCKPCHHKVHSKGGERLLENFAPNSS